MVEVRVVSSTRYERIKDVILHTKYSGVKPSELQAVPSRIDLGKKFFGKPKTNTTRGVYRHTFVCCASLLGDVLSKGFNSYTGGMCVLPKHERAFEGARCIHCKLFVHRDCKAVSHSKTDICCPLCFYEHEDKKYDHLSSRQFQGYRLENEPWHEQFIPQGLATFSYWNPATYKRLDYNREVYALARQFRYPEETEYMVRLRDIQRRFEFEDSWLLPEMCPPPVVVQTEQVVSGDVVHQTTTEVATAMVTRRMERTLLEEQIRAHVEKHMYPSARVVVATPDDRHTNPMDGGNKKGRNDRGEEGVSLSAPIEKMSSAPTVQEDSMICLDGENDIRTEQDSVIVTDSSKPRRIHINVKAYEKFMQQVKESHAEMNRSRLPICIATDTSMSPPEKTNRSR